MPIQVTYPGVYIEELPSGSKTIGGVATAVTAFAGRALRGPTDLDGPVTIFGFDDYVGTFGGLHQDYPLGYAVQDFFLNGGAKAIIVRIYKDDDKIEGDGYARMVIDNLASAKSGAQKVVDAIEEELYNPASGRPTAAAMIQAAKDAAAKVQGEPMATAAKGIVTAASAAPNPTSLQPAAKDAAAKAPDGSPKTGAKAVTDAVDLAIKTQKVAGVKAAAGKAAGELKDKEKEEGDKIVEAIKDVDDPSTFVSTATAAMPADGTDGKEGATKVLAAIEAEVSNPNTASDSAAVKKAADDAAGKLTDEKEKVGAKLVTDALNAPATPESVLAAAKNAVKSVAPGDPINEAGQLRFIAANPGSWGNLINVSIDYDNLTEAMDGVYDGLKHTDLFNLEVSFAPAGGLAVSERHINLTTKVGYQGERRLDRVLDNESILLRAVRDENGNPVWPNSHPFPTTYKADGAGAASAPLDTLAYLGNEKRKTGIYALEKVDLFNLLCIPPDGRDPNKDTWDTPLDVYQSAANYCYRKRAMLIIDPPKKWSTMARTGKVANILLSDEYNFADMGRNCAVYFPRVKRSNPMLKGVIEVFPACGMVAGVMSRTDVNRGVWKAPAGTEAGLVGARGLELPLTDNENGMLNPQGINCLRTFPVIGTVAWGGRTLRGADQLSDDYKYINVRRLTLYIEESLFRGTQFAVFEPNSSELWSTLKAAADSFMASLAKQGAFYSYEVVCDSSTTTARDINMGRVNMLVAFAPVKPAEFVVIQIKQQALKE